MPTTTGKIYLGSTLVSGGVSPAAAADWVRNPFWPALTDPLSTEQKIVGLYAVWPGDGIGKGGNFFAFLAQGAYTINYGDGTITNYANNTRADYEFDYNSASLSGTNAPVTFTITNNTVNRTAHGRVNGDTIKLYYISGTTNIVEGLTYYVINASTNSFQISTTLNGSPLAFGGANGNASLLPYKVAVVTITPQAGQNLTSVNFFQRNGKTGLSASYSTGWLDVVVSLPNCAGSGLTFSSTATTLYHAFVERFRIVNSGSLNSIGNMFGNCRMLQIVSGLPSLNNVTSLALTFFGCTSLKYLPEFTGSAGNITSITQMCAGCTSLVIAPALPVSIASLTNMSSAYSGCINLSFVPPFPTNTSAATNVGAMFSTCRSLPVIPVMDLTGVTSSTNLVNFTGGCDNLSRMQAFNQRFSFSLASLKLSAAALNEIFAGLPTVTGQTITVTGNYGVNEAGYNPSIATTKGWTVTS